MSRLRRTGTGDLRPPPLGPYPDTTFQIRGPHLTCPGTSSSGTALLSSPLGPGPSDGDAAEERTQPAGLRLGEVVQEAPFGLVARGRRPRQRPPALLGERDDV